MQNDQLHKLFVGSLPADISKEELEYVFKTYGQVTNIHVMDASKSKTGDACAFISYATRQAGQDAITVLNGVYKIRAGDDAKALIVDWAKEAGGGKGRGGNDGGKGYGGGKGYDNGYNSGGYRGGKDDWNSGGSGGGWQDGGGGSWGQSSWNTSSWQGGGNNSWQDRSWGGGGGGGSHGGGRDYGGGGSNYGGGGSNYGGGSNDWGGSSGKAHSTEAPAAPPSNKLFVGNLPNEIQEDALRYVFGTYGTVNNIHVMAGKSKSGQSCAFVEMGSVEEAGTAIATLDQKYEIKPGDGCILVKHATPKERPRPY